MTDLSEKESSWLNTLARAQQGSDGAIGELLQRVRDHLLAAARDQLDSDLRAKEAASDLVQKSMMEAAQDLQSFRGGTEAEFQAWLRAILANNVRDLLAKFTAEKRSLDREIPLDGPRNPAANLVAADQTPSAQAVRKEEIESVQRMLERLSAEQRELIRMRHQENRSFAEIASLLGISEAAAQKRWARTIEELRQGLSGSPQV